MDFKNMTQATFVGEETSGKPNHFGEIMEWLGFALMCWNLASLSFVVWTCSNLLPRALHHHKWYLQHFADYPKDRKAVIPFLL